MMAFPPRLKSFVNVNGVRHVDVQGGGVLTLRRGRVGCFVEFSECVLGPASLLAAHQPFRPRQAGMTDEDAVRAAIELCDSDGAIYRCERLINASILFNLVRVSCPFGGSTRLLMSGVRCLYEERWPLATIGMDGKAFAYRGKHLTVFLDLLSTKLTEWEDQLVVRVRPTDGAALDGDATPEVIAVTNWAARVVLDLDVLETADLPRDPLTFVPMGTLGEPQPNVRFLPGER